MSLTCNYFINIRSAGRSSKISQLSYTTDGVSTSINCSEIF